MTVPLIIPFLFVAGSLLYILWMIFHDIPGNIGNSFANDVEAIRRQIFLDCVDGRLPWDGLPRIFRDSLSLIIQERKHCTFIHYWILRWSFSKVLRQVVRHQQRFLRIKLSKLSPEQQGLLRGYIEQFDRRFEAYVWRSSPLGWLMSITVLFSGKKNQFSVLESPLLWSLSRFDSVQKAALA
jgi:hypothetical protein